MHSVDVVGDIEMIFDKMKPKIRHRLYDIVFTFGENLGKTEPDLTPMDFYLWGTVKDEVYRRKPRTLEDLRQEITAACAGISIETLTDLAAATARRCLVCQAANGEHFEHLK
ncbi:hypothetical protein ANN_15334 [Periplaneta americana]|uniref:Uncharacterized protein n=1 Tax=Periplaneta americana TaxID=6978 RepID=A0ABQ8SG44_PERAM|nr:hypothetical protein ANN_15334 [Periplaneta americana]